MDLLSKINQMCYEHGLSLAQLERSLKFGNGSMSRWNKSSPSIDKVKKVADYFSVSIGYLLNEEKEMNSFVESNFSKELIELQKNLNKLSPKTKKNIIKMIHSFAEDED